MTLVSVVLPAFDRPHFLMPAIESVFAQQGVDFELLVIDDGSGEATRNLLAGLKHPSLRVIRRAHSGNPGAVRNAGIREARGRHVAFLDSDDLWQPRKLQRQCAGLRANTKARWSYTACSHIDANGQSLTPEGVESWRVHVGPMAEAVGCLRAHSALPTVMAERELLLEVGAFDEGLSLYEDHDLWLRLALRSEPDVVAEPLVQVCRHQSHYSGRDPLREAECRAEFLERAWRHLAQRECRAELRRLRTLQAARLARLRAEQGLTHEARRLLLSTWRDGVRHPRWWLDAAHCVMAPASSRGAP